MKRRITSPTVTGSSRSSGTSTANSLVQGITCVEGPPASRDEAARRTKTVLRAVRPFSGVQSPSRKASTSTPSSTTSKTKAAVISILIAQATPPQWMARWTAASAQPLRDQVLGTIWRLSHQVYDRLYDAMEQDQPVDLSHLALTH